MHPPPVGNPTKRVAQAIFNYIHSHPGITQVVVFPE